MNTTVTSKEEILKACREIVSEEGLSAVSMRSVAAKCGIALGSLYNYFPNKDELVLAAIESVWHDIFHMGQPQQSDLSFPEYVKWIFTMIQKSTSEYPHFFTAHSLSVTSHGRNAAKDTMSQNLSHIKAEMMKCLDHDPKVKKNVFHSGFSKADFTAFVLDHLILLILQEKENCNTLLKVIENTIYESK